MLILPKHSALIRYCGDTKALADGRLAHAQIIKSSLQQHAFTGSLLRGMYDKCEDLEDAQALFAILHPRNLLLWNCFITICARQGQGMDLFQLLHHMQQEGIMPSEATFVCILSASTSQASLGEGKRMHACILERGFESHLIVGTALINMYGKYNELKEARNVFDRMPQRNVITWTTMIAVHARNGQCREALQFFKQMLWEGVTPDKVTFVSILTVCASPEALAEGKRMHALIVTEGIESDVILASALLNMYGKCASLNHAQRMFNRIPQGNVVSWTTMIALYAEYGCGDDALHLFCIMQQHGILPNKVTFFNVLAACVCGTNLAKGMQIHALMMGFKLEAILESALVKMYGKCGSLDHARRVFNGMPKRNVVSWNALLEIYVENGKSIEIIQLFEQMHREGIIADQLTFVSVLAACATQRLLFEGKRVHVLAVDRRWDSEILVGTALVSMYGKCGIVEDARRVFDKMVERNMVSWTAMISVYAQHGQGKEALQLWNQMQEEGVVPDSVLCATMLAACTSEATLDGGQFLHICVVKSGFERDVVIGNALISMYGKCGNLEDAQKLFDKMMEYDVVSLNAMIAVYGQHGQGKNAIRLFYKMLQEGILPDKVTFVSLLAACSHSGLIYEGWHFFNSMDKDHLIFPNRDHYICMIDLLGRSGLLVDAENLIHQMPFPPTAQSFVALLGACNSQIDVERGERAAKHALDLNSLSTAAYVMLSNIYATACRGSSASDMKLLPCRVVISDFKYTSPWVFNSASGRDEAVFWSWKLSSGNGRGFY